MLALEPLVKAAMNSSEWRYLQRMGFLVITGTQGGAPAHGLGLLIAVSGDDLLRSNVVCVEIRSHMRLQHHPIFKNVQNTTAFLHGNADGVVGKHDFAKFDSEVILVAAAGALGDH